MSLTLIMTWDIKDNKEQEYMEFVLREWVPATNRLGLKTVAAWYTQYRKDESIPLVRAEALVDDRAAMRKILSSSEWDHIFEQLLEYVDNYKHKIVETTGEFRI
jgi:hypothetical protein